MARVQLTYPTSGPAPMATGGGNQPSPSYPQMPTKDQRFRLFGMLPFGPGANTPLYDTPDPAVRALYGLDDSNRGSALPNPTTSAPPTPSTPFAVPRTPIANYGVNDTGRTTSFNPNPSYSNTTTLPMAAPTYPNGSGAQPTTPGTSNQFGGFLGALMGLLTGKNPSQSSDYEAALRERPADIQRLVSMSKRPSNAGGFLGGLFDNKG